MKENILQTFLDAGMVNIGDDDEKFNYLRLAANDVAQNLVDQQFDIVRLAATAFAPSLTVDNSVLNELEGSLKKQWNTYKIRFPDAPEQLLRAVALEALQVAASSVTEAEPVVKPNVAVSTITYLIGINLLPYMPEGRQREICSDFLMDLGEKMEKHAEELWSAGHDAASVPIFSIDSIDQVLVEGAVKINEDTLSTGLMAAVGPYKDAANSLASGPDPNPSWPAQSGAWVQAFGQRAAKAITSTFNEANSSRNENLSEVLKEFFQTFCDFSERANQMSRLATTGGMTRTNLLWWKEALYSPLLHMGYRSLDPTSVVVALAQDFHNQMFSYHPQSAEFFLREVVHDVLGDNSTAITVLQLGEQIIVASEENNDIARLLSGWSTRSSPTLSLLQFIKDLAARKALPTEVTMRVGIPADTLVSNDEIAVWLFREMQAWRLADAGR